MLMSLVNKAVAEPHSPVVSSGGNLSEQADPQHIIPDLDFTFVKGQMTNDAMTFGQEKRGLRDATARVIIV
jgi:hypothetical protein